jgi:hypothetical protein
MFGGEFCDGEGTTVFNDLFRWNVEKGGGEWYVRTCRHRSFLMIYIKFCVSFSTHIVLPSNRGCHLNSRLFVITRHNMS